MRTLIEKTRKRPMSLARTYYFRGDEKWDAATPLRAMAQFVKRHPGFTVLAVGIDYYDDGEVTVVLTVEG